MTGFARIALFALLVGAGFRPVLAQQTSEPIAEISAISYQPFPPHTSLAMEPADRSLLTEQVGQYLERMLPQNHYPIDPAARYGLVIRVALITPNVDDQIPGHYQLLRLKFKYPGDRVPRHEYHIALSIYDHESGLYIWRGEVARADESQPIDAITGRMVEALVQAIGKNFKQTPLEAQ